MGGTRRNQPDAWWLVAGPVTGVAAGAVLGAVSGWLGTPTEGVGPFVGDPVSSTIVGTVMGITLGVFTGLVVGTWLMFMVRGGRPASTARLIAGFVGLVCGPAVLLLLASIGRVGLGQIGAAPLVTVAATAAVLSAWLVGRTPDRAHTS